MIPYEGLVAILDATIGKAMLLCLFTDGPNEMTARFKDFTEAQHYEPRRVTRRDWLVDQEKAEATLDKHTFKFERPAGKMKGWMLRTVEDGTVVAFDHFADPYPINSDEDTVSVRASLRLRQTS